MNLSVWSLFDVPVANGTLLTRRLLLKQHFFGDGHDCYNSLGKTAALAYEIVGVDPQHCGTTILMISWI